MTKKDAASVEPQSQEQVERLPMPEPEGGWPPDEFTGVGGSYVRDPLTGVRSPAPVVGE